LSDQEVSVQNPTSFSSSNDSINVDAHILGHLPHSRGSQSFISRKVVYVLFGDDSVLAGAYNAS
jgi:hypothetical protein